MLHLHSRRMVNCYRFLLPVALLVAGSALRGGEVKQSDRWEKDIQAFERQDRMAPPPKGSVMFMGSSSIRYWDVAKSFPETKVLNRGFGGSQIADSVRYVERLISHEPRLIVFYAGDNDIAGGKSAEQVLKDFQALVTKVNDRLPRTRIAFISIKPSPSRLNQMETQRKANKLIEDFIQTDKRLSYIDVVAPMLDQDGKPRAELFREDKLHLNADGYKLWTEVVGPYLVSE